MPRARASAAIRSLSGPSPTITSRAALWVIAAKARTSRGRFLTARNPATVPITTSPGRPLEAGDRARLRRRGETRDRNAVGDAQRSLPQILRAIRSSRSEGTTSR